jgi:hypothetical protein
MRMPRKPVGEVAMTSAERMRRHRARRSKREKAKHLAQRRNAYAEQNEDAYITCPEATICLLHLERQHLPHVLFEPGAGAGAITLLLRRAGHKVITCDIRDYGLPGCLIADYLTLTLPPGIEGLVFNPPYKKALQFLEKALADGVPYIAMLVRTHWLVERRGARPAARRRPPADASVDFGTPSADHASRRMDRQDGPQQRPARVGDLASWGKARISPALQLARNTGPAGMARMGRQNLMRNYLTLSSGIGITPLNLLNYFVM